jgi:hypothetical protein
VGTIPSPTPTPTSCEKPVITSFTPTSGGYNTILTIRGKYLQATTSITINDVIVTKGIIKSSDGTQLTVTVPKSPLTGIQSNTILVKTQNGDITSTNKFTYNPASTGTYAPAVPKSDTNVSTQTQTDNAKTESSTFQDGQTGPKVLLETITTLPTGTMQKILANVNTDNGVGTWTINESVNIQLQLFSYEIGANNSIKKVLIKEVGFIELGYVLNKGQLFSITSLDIENIINFLHSKTIVDSYL